MKSKKILICIIATLTLLILNTSVFAANVYVQLNGDIVDFTDSNGQRVDAQIINDRTMVPLRKIFELLGATVDWDGTTSTAFATKDNISIKLQINNPVAEVTENDITRKITLDSKPVIVNSRTLVPLRFISESLGKQVAWDAREQTAIIIDYDYFVNKLKQKSPMLYKTLTSKSEVATIQITRDYYDLKNSSNNTTSKIYATVSNDSENSQSIVADLTGTSELFGEIKNEGWSSINFVINYTDTGFSFRTSSEILNKMLEKKQYTYEAVDLDGKYNDSLSNAMRNFFGIEEKDISIVTFARMNNDFTNFISLFNSSNTVNSSTITNNKFSSITTNNFLYDYATFDNIIFDNEFAKIFNVVNKILFNYDVTFNEMIYTYPNTNITLTIEEKDGNLISNASIVLLNDFNEKVVYDVKIVK